MSETKGKKSLSSRRGPVKQGRRKSSVSKVEEIVFKLMDGEEGSGDSLPDGEKDSEPDYEFKEENKLIKRLVLLGKNSYSSSNIHYFPFDRTLFSSFII